MTLHHHADQPDVQAQTNDSQSHGRTQDHKGHDAGTSYPGCEGQGNETSCNVRHREAESDPEHASDPDTEPPRRLGPGANLPRLRLAQGVRLHLQPFLESSRTFVSKNRPGL